MRSSSIFSWEFCYIYFTISIYSDSAPTLYLRLYWYFCASYNGDWIDNFVNVIQSNHSLYFILGSLSYISTVYELFFHCVVDTSAFVLLCLWMLYICLMWYVGVLHTIFSLVVRYIGKIVIHIYCLWFVIPLLQSSLTCIHKIWLTSILLN